MSRWYRAYSGTVRDDKLAEAAVVAGCSRSVAIAAWHAILESAAETSDGGRFDTTPRRVAAILNEGLPAITSLFEALSELGMIEGQTVHSWKKRQFESDSSTERSRKHREAKRNGDATLQQQPATPPETDTEAEKEDDDAREPTLAIADAYVAAVTEAAIPEGHALLGDVLAASVCIGWIKSGFDVRLDAIPAVSKALTGRYRIIRWEKLTSWVQNQHADRVAAEMARPPPVIVEPKAATVTQLRPRNEPASNFEIGRFVAANPPPGYG